MKTLVDQVQAGGVTQIVVMGITTADVTIATASAISTALAELVFEENVAAVDVTEFSTFRGDKFAWAYLANTFHPDASGHMLIAKMTSTLFTDEHFNVMDLGSVGATTGGGGGGCGSCGSATVCVFVALAALMGKRRGAGEGDR